MEKTNYAEFRQIMAQINDCALAFIGNEKYDISVNMVNFLSGDELLTGISVFIHGENGIVRHHSFNTYSSAEENYATLQELWDFVGENTEG